MRKLGGNWSIEELRKLQQNGAATISSNKELWANHSIDRRSLELCGRGVLPGYFAHRVGALVWMNYSGSISCFLSVFL